MFIEGDESETEDKDDKSQTENHLGDTNSENDLDEEQDLDSENTEVVWIGSESDMEEGI